MKKTIIKVVLLFFLLFFVPVSVVQASSEKETNYLNDLDYTEIEKVLSNVLKTDQPFSFEDYVNGIVTGEKQITFTEIINQLKNSIRNEWADNKNHLVQLFLISIIAAVFTNFSSVFKGKQIAETGFYITYMLLFSILTVSFAAISALAASVLSNLLDFMKVLVPSYFMTVAFSSGTNTSIVFYQFTMVLITIVDAVLIKIIIPVVNIYFILTLANYITKEDRFSKMAELIRSIVTWSLKTILGFVIGFQSIQALVLPVSDKVRNGMLLKAAKTIPGAGNILGSVAETVLGAGVLVKNAVGVTGLIVIILICAAPMIKILIFTFVYQLGAAMVQPISDKRIISCINATADSSKLLLMTVFIGALLFLFTIAIVTASTNLRV